MNATMAQCLDGFTAVHYSSERPKQLGARVQRTVTHYGTRCTSTEPLGATAPLKHEVALALPFSSPVGEREGWGLPATWGPSQQLHFALGFCQHYLAVGTVGTVGSCQLSLSLASLILPGMVSWSWIGPYGSSVPRCCQESKFMILAINWTRHLNNRELPA